MSRLLFLAGGDVHGYTDIHNRSILDGLPGEVMVLANAPTARYFAGLPVQLEVVRWYDTAAVQARVLALHAVQPFTALATIDERMMELAAQLRDALDLPGLRSADVPRFRDKPTMKRLLGAAGVRVPEFAHSEDRAGVEALLARHERVVIKPVDGMGSFGVVFAETALVSGRRTIGLNVALNLGRVLRGLTRGLHWVLTFSTQAVRPERDAVSRDKAAAIRLDANDTSG